MAVFAILQGDNKEVEGSKEERGKEVSKRETVSPFFAFQSLPSPRKPLDCIILDLSDTISILFVKCAWVSCLCG